MNQPFRFIQSSDFHLERPPRGLAEVPDHLRTGTRHPYRAAERVFDAAIKERVDFVVLVGDLLDPLAISAPAPRSSWRSSSNGWPNRESAFIGHQAAATARRGGRITGRFRRAYFGFRCIAWRAIGASTERPTLGGANPRTQAQQRRRIRTADFRTNGSICLRSEWLMVRSILR